MKIKLEWQEFVDIALQAIKEIHPTAKADTLFFGKRYYNESDGEAYEKPDFIEIEI